MISAMKIEDSTMPWVCCAYVIYWKIWATLNPLWLSLCLWLTMPLHGSLHRGCVESDWPNNHFWKKSGLVKIADLSHAGWKGYKFLRSQIVSQTRVRSTPSYQNKPMEGKQGWTCRPLISKSEETNSKNVKGLYFHGLQMCSYLQMKFAAISTYRYTIL